MDSPVFGDPAFHPDPLILSLGVNSQPISPLELRTRVHSLIDAVKSEELLQRIHDLLAGSGEASGEGVWASMTDAQRERVMLAYSSSLDPRNLSGTDEVMKRRKG